LRPVRKQDWTFVRPQFNAKAIIAPDGGIAAARTTGIGVRHICSCAGRVLPGGAREFARLRLAMTASYLAALNPEQQRAVEYGVGNPFPLLVVAGAGSGKTNTLAHRGNPRATPPIRK